ncbi:MAG: hypothetical protein ACI4RN_07065 [Oscillospiraceae bacterium]
MARIPRQTQDDIIMAARELLINAEYDKSKAMRTLKLQLEAHNIKHVDEVLSFYSKIMDCICDYERKKINE